MVLTGVSPAATVGWAAVIWGFGQADHPNGSFTGLAADLAVDSQTHNSVVTRFERLHAPSPVEQSESIQDG